MEILEMARKVRDATMDTRQARTKLAVRGPCHWRTIERGAHLGYRRLRAQPGTWWGRFYIGDREYAVEPLGIADDRSDADGVQVLSYDQAVETVREARARRLVAAEPAATEAEALPPRRQQRMTPSSSCPPHAFG